MKTIDINLTRLLRLFGRISTGNDSEIEYIKRYSYNVTSENNTYKDFYNYLTAKSYMAEGDYDELEVRNFYKINKLNDAIEKFTEMLEYLLLNKVTPYFENIVFNSIVNYTSDNLIVKFTVVDSYE